MTPDFTKKSDADLKRDWARNQNWKTYDMTSEMRRCYMMQEIMGEWLRRGNKGDDL